jgi:hypothetical protein
MSTSSRQASNRHRHERLDDRQAPTAVEIDQIRQLQARGAAVVSRWSQARSMASAHG